jgi:hypothetical protein
MKVWPEPDFSNLPGELSALFAAAGETSFFARAEWYALMARHAREPGQRIRLYADGEAAGLALVCRDSGRFLHGLSNPFSLEFGPIHARMTGDAGAALADLAMAIADERPAWQLFTLAALDPAAPSFAALLDGLSAARWVARPFFDSGTWFEATDGLDFPRYFDARPSVLKNTYRRKVKAARDLRLDYAFSDPGADIDRLIDEYETVYRNSWKKTERFATFMPALMRLAFATGALRLGVVRVDGVPAAAQFWLLWRGRATIYKLAHDERLSKLSLGTLLTMRMMERVLDNDKPVEIDFGRGDDGYKRLWLPRRRERWGIRAANPRTWRGLGLSARFLAGRLRDRMLSQSCAASDAAGVRES